MVFDTVMIKRYFHILLILGLFCDCQSQNRISYRELQEIDSALNFEITNYMYLSSYEYYYSQFQFPSAIDTLFDFMFESLSLHSKQCPFPDNIKTLLSDNKTSFVVHIMLNKLVVLYRDSIFFSFDVPFSCDEFSETGSYAGFLRNKVVCHDHQANQLEKSFNHLVWKLYTHSVNKLHGQHIINKDNSSLGYIGFTFDFQQDSLVVHNICSYEMCLHQPYYTSLQKLSRRFCRKHKYDGLFFSAPFVYSSP